MTRENAKELLPIIEAYANGETIEMKTAKGNWITDLCPMFTLSWDKYRIKSESSYRPFKDAKECWNEMLQHQPFGWVKVVENNDYYDISSVVQDEDGGIWLDEKDYWTFDDAVNLLTFADGAPFGTKVF